VSHLLRDVRYALRCLARTPGFSLVVVLTLALGIGANAAMFGVVDTLFVRPPALVRDPGRIARVYVRRPMGPAGTFTGSTVSYRTFEDLRDAPGPFAEVAAVVTRPLSLGRGADAVQIRGSAVSHEYFRLMGVAPALGRFFAAEEDQVGAERVAVLSSGFWRRRFAGDRAVLGRTLPIGGGTYTVIGVTPEGFSGIDLRPVDVWVPIRVAAVELGGRDALTSRNWFWMSIIGRLTPGVMRADAASLATSTYRRGVAQGRSQDTTASVILGPVQAARGPEAGDETKVSAWIGGVALIVLLIACANVANLLLARGVARRRELAVRAGLGAGRGGLMRLLLAESLVLAALGGGAALLLAVWAGAGIRGLLIPSLPKDLPVLDLRVLGFTAFAVVVTAILAGIVPAVQSSRTELAEALKGGGHGATTRGGRTRALLLAAQVALTLVLLVGGGLFVRSLRNVQSLDLGLDADRVLLASVDLDAGATRDRANALYLGALERIQRLPGVEHAAGVAMQFGWGWATDLRAEGVDSIPALPGGGPYVNVVTPDYFAAMGTRLARGRGFTAADGAGSEMVAVVNRTMARLLWPGGESLGKCLYVGDATRACRRVVGVFADARREGVIEEPTMQYFLPQGQYEGPGGAQIQGLVIRARGAPSALAPVVRGEIQAMGDVPFADVQTLAARLAPDYRSWRLGATAFTAFGALALVIAAMGIFAVISYSVSQRTQEIGIRMALGAEAAQVARMILGQGLRATLLGVAAGAAGGYALGRALRALLYEVRPADPMVFGTVAAMLIAVAAAAAYLPARRAARVDPMTALRTE
jgi:predicted permease